MVKLTKRDLTVIAGLAGAADFLAEGRFSAPVARALKSAGKAAFTRGGPTVARFTGATALRAAGTIASVGKTIALRHPVLTAGAVVYYTYQNRDELGSLVEQGYEVVQDFGDITRSKFEEGVRPLKKVKKRMTAFNSAVKKGMSIVKGSTSFGGKGKINNAKKAFAVK